MRAFAGIVILLFIASIVRAQNHFPNPGFEQYALCPDYTSQIERCIGWDSINGTADYFNCGFYMNSTLGNYGVPHSGSGAVGIIVSPPYVGNPTQWYGEIFGAALLQPLIPGATYRLSSWWLSPSTCLPVISVDCYDVGFYFYKSAHPPVIPLYGCTNIVPQVRIAPNEILEMSYTQFTTDFVADSCYDRVMIGFFCRDTTTTPFCLQNNDSEYFDVDDISLVKIADPPPSQSSFSASAADVCAGDSITWLNTSSANRTGFSWSFDGGTPSSTIGPGPHVIAYPNPGVYSTSLITTYECGSDTLADVAEIKINSLPELVLFADTASLCTGTPRVLRAESNVPATWSTGETGEEIIVKAEGWYIARAENACGIAQDSIFTPYGDCPCDVWIPSAFTPNEDGKNEEFIVYTNCVLEQFHLSIYNRFGQKVFSGDDLSSGWNGHFSGPAPSGIYVAVIQYTGWEDGKLKHQEVTRKVTLLR